MDDHGQRGYALPMRMIHWLMAAIMLYVIVVGFLMGNGFKVGKHYDYHRASGFLLMLLVVVRLLIYRFTTPPSPLPVSMSTLQKRAAEAVHFLLYASLIIQPFLGWYATNAWGVKNIPFFFGWTLPQLVEKDRDLGNFLLEIHHYLGLFITALVVIHISAALMHHFAYKDNVLKRMMKT
ncbi:MAG: cytochrome b [Rhizobiaceae bacterium]|nr:cytochrome b [Rhizobiaceae bacterium]